MGHLVEELLVEFAGSVAHRHRSGSHSKQRQNETPSPNVSR
jgi:hypothetical protein